MKKCRDEMAAADARSTAAKGTIEKRQRSLLESWLKEMESLVSTADS